MKKFLLLLLLAVIAGPPIAWKMGDDRSTTVTILDESVVNVAVSDHAGLVWLMDQERVRRPTGSTHQIDDYFGYFPHGDPDVRRLEPLVLEDTDLLYLADARGIWRSGLESFEMMRDASRDQVLHSGFSENEIAAIERFVMSGRLTVAEAFLFYANHEGINARQRLEDLFGVKWTGWIAGWFQELNDVTEVPFWVRGMYERTQQQSWPFRGPGVIFINPGEGEFVVLTPGVELRTPRPEIIVSQRRGALSEGVASSMPLWGWFEVVEANDPATVHSLIRLNLTGAGQNALEEHRLPFTYPGVVAQWVDRETYYMAADFGHLGTWLGPAQIKWIPDLRGQLASAVEGQFPGEQAFWRFYIPFMRNILGQVSRQ